MVRTTETKGESNFKQTAYTKNPHLNFDTRGAQIHVCSDSPLTFGVGRQVVELTLGLKQSVTKTAQNCGFSHFTECAMH